MVGGLFELLALLTGVGASEGAKSIKGEMDARLNEKWVESFSVEADRHLTEEERKQKLREVNRRHKEEDDADFRRAMIILPLSILFFVLCFKLTSWLNGLF